jgi:hypothetical protein
VVTVVTGNASNSINAVYSMALAFGHTCAAHSVQLGASKELAHNEIERLCQKAGKIIGHFRHSNLATHTLESVQEQRHVPKENIIQSVNARWNSTFDILQRFLRNRNPIANDLADHKITPAATDQKLVITKPSWIIIMSQVPKATASDEHCVLLGQAVNCFCGSPSH